MRTEAYAATCCDTFSPGPQHPGVWFSTVFPRHEHCRAMNGTYAHSADAPVPLDHVADVICRSLNAALPQQCADRHSIDVAVTCTEEGLPMTLRVQCEDLFAMNIRVAVEHVGGNVYDVFCTIEDGASCQLTYGCPEDEASPLPLCPRLGEKFAAFVLDELEQRLGRWHLRKEED